MAFFAEIDETNTVIQIHTLHDNELKDSDGVEQEEMGIQFMRNFHGGNRTYVRCFLKGSSRKNYPGPGYTYDESNDVFISPKPFPSWALNSDHNWTAPKSKPDDWNGQNYVWNETTKEWDDR